jgi:S1-C subfamily serine protease
VVVGGDGVEDADVGLYASDRELGADLEDDRDAVAHHCFSADQEVEVRVRATRGSGPLYLVAYTTDEQRTSWPSWQGTKPNRPARISTHHRSAESLYRTAAKSIFVVASGDTRGSAVAVSARHLLTNCHVLTSDDVLLKRGSTIAVAHLVRADRETDRCILSTDDVVLVPVLGVRPFNRLRIGETVFAIGAPRGQEGSISSGIISRFDSASGIDSIQVTAAISPGSSGGPLFDSYGNLIGITTYQRTDAQSINFALAADAWWK